MSAAPRLYHPDPSEALPEELRRRAKTGDLLLYRGSGLFSWLTQTAGRTRYSHAGMFLDGRDLGERLPESYVGEMTFWNPRIRSLAAAVRECPGRWEWRPMAESYRAKFNTRLAAKAMRELTDLPYGRGVLIRTALTHTPVVRWFVRPNLSDGSHASRRCNKPTCSHAIRPKLDVPRLIKSPPDCSAAVAIACRHGGFDPVPNLADAYTEPADLARSLMWDTPGLILQLDEYLDPESPDA